MEGRIVLSGVEWLWSWLLRSNPDAWAASAGWITVALAVTASVIGYHQVKEAKALRLEQAQPYVVAYMEPSQASQNIIDLVVKNFGATAAFDVRISSVPELSRSGGQNGEVEVVKVFKVLPILAPQQEWRTFWDAGTTRKDVDLPDEYRVTVEYKDSRGDQMTDSVAILDWNIYKNRMWADVYGLHEAAGALRDIRTTIKGWSETPGRGIAVYSRDGNRKDERDREDARETRRKLEALNQRVLGGGKDDADVAGTDEGPRYQNGDPSVTPNGETESAIESGSGDGSGSP